MNERRDRRPWRPLPGKSQPTPVRDTLDRLASTLGLGSIDGAEQLLTRWSEIVGDDVASHCQPAGLVQGVLTVRAEDPQWATELSWMTGLIAERCNEALGDGAVTEVKISR